ncbi:fasciclin domain-containing protein [Microbispora sp. RL4-1S]|uniref:Fasciclin domain-containing protein n=1 Tax=Microbispora oryzae TaxID=2806554 RepID=A0A940WJV3_9ACTN|nr:fasciclin domain-containing protein [Microbispora oryzae]MBP2706861.1 fasciclin domain-containing protein [Microbispora oryzae]
MKSRLLALSAFAAALALCTSCGGQSATTSAAPAAANESETASEGATAETSQSESATASPGASATPFGPGCSSLPASGPGSAAEVAKQPVATALASIPSLSTLAKAVKKAGLVETLNAADGITVFAPTNEAFDKIPKKKLDQVLADRKALTTLLSYHVVKGRKSPSDLQSGKVSSLQGSDLTVSGSGDNLKVNDANIVCGNVSTRNATVYMIDKVLMPR